MKNRINCVMLVDDNEDDNFYHERVIKKSGIVNVLLSKESGTEAIDYLNGLENNKTKPDLILMDINMPGMNGWEFLDKYKELDEKQRQSIIIVILTTSENLDDKEKASTQNLVADFRTKPLTIDMLYEMEKKYFR